MRNIKLVLEQHFGVLQSPTPTDLKRAFDEADISMRELEPHLGEPGVYPYGRKPLFTSDEVEVIVMNWAVGRVCAPHDHGRSFGWIRVVTGSVLNTLYTLDQDDKPVAFKSVLEPTGSFMFAPRSAIHSMGSVGNQRTVTLHAYAPCIHGMIVYDLAKCAACVVSDDCGAWWPSDQRQLVKEIKLAQGLHSGGGR
jgi:cysteine dioxygenase